MMRCISVGRLEREKGIHHLLWLCKHVALHSKYQWFELHIFWSWSMEQHVIEASETYQFLTYHGHQPKEEVFKIRKTCDYTFVLSSFLETFGLVALDSLAMWVPVIWYKKWWLQPFMVDRRLQVDSYQWENVHQQLLWLLDYLMTHVEPATRQTWSTKASNIYENYHPNLRVERFRELSRLPVWSKILLVSDYAVDIGWIENLLFAMKSLLEKEWYEVEFVWYSKKVPSRKRYAQLLVTACNIPFALRLGSTVKAFQPDLIWWHSVHRRIWWLPVSMQKRYSAKQWVMYHDFWLFHPFPRLVNSEHQLEQSSTFPWFIKEWVKVGWWVLPLLFCKRVALRITRAVLSSMDMHLVPSSYMETVVQRAYPHVDRSRIKTFSHFVKDE